MSHFRRISLKEAQALEAAGKAYRPSAHQPGVYYGTAMVPENLDAVTDEEPPPAKEQPVKEQVYETRAMEAKPRTGKRRTLKNQ
jgi:hypothetical protein